MRKIGIAASEEKSFENVHDDGRRQTKDGRTPNTSIYYKLTYAPSAQVSLKKHLLETCFDLMFYVHGKQLRSLRDGQFTSI